MRLVGIVRHPDGTGFITPEFVAYADARVVIEVMGERFAVTGWDSEQLAFVVASEPPRPVGEEAA